MSRGRRSADGRLTIIVLCPHFEPDTAPTGAVMTRIVHELGRLGHEIHVVTSLPWYRDHRVDGAWADVGWRNRTTVTEFGSVTRLNPFAGGDRTNLLRRALGFVGFTVLSLVAGLRVARSSRRVDAVIAMSPPLTIGLCGWLVALARRGRLVFNIQDVFPDAAVETGAITNRWVIAVARLLEKISYRASHAVTVLSDDLRDNVAAKLPARQRSKVVVIPNFVDTEAIQPMPSATAYRRELGLDDRPVVMYAGNVGFSQSLDLVIGAAAQRPDYQFVVNGSGSARASLEESASSLSNVAFGDYQPIERLSEVLATGDVHVVPLRTGLGRVSVPSKTYSIMAAGRPVVAAIDAGTEVTRMVAACDGGVCVPPDDLDSFVTALDAVLRHPDEAARMGSRAREYVLSIASPSAVAARYEDLIRGL